MTAYLLESSLAQFKNVVCCFQTISCLLSFKEGNEWISSSAFFIFSLMKENKKFTFVFTGNVSEVAALKLAMSQGGAGSPSHNALRMNYIINCRLSRDILFVSGVHGVRLRKSTISLMFVVRIIRILRFWSCVVL